MDNRLQELVGMVKSSLLSCHTIKIRNDWTEECIKFFLSQNPAISNEDVFISVLDQFVLADVKQMSNPVIPLSIMQNKQPFTLYGTFVMQMQFLVDIGIFQHLFSVLPAKSHFCFSNF